LSELGSALDELGAEELRLSSDDELKEGFGDLQRAAERLESERLRRLAEIDRRQACRHDEYLSTASWLADQFRLPRPVAARDVHTARALQDMPWTREGLASGEVTSSAARQLASAREAAPDDFGAQEATLVDAARTLSAAQLRRVVEYWRQAVDSERALEDAEHLRERRRLYVSTTFLGMVRVDGDLDPETGEAFITALQAIQDADVRRGSPDDRTPAQRRADALGEMTRQWLDFADRPNVAGERRHLTVIMDLEALEGRAGKRCEMDHAGPIHPETARHLACDASVSRIITGPRSEPLDVGRRTPVVPAGMRRAVVVRDGHCRFPGCDRPHTWCDSHQIVHWADGGRTADSNLILLCRRHHRLVHRELSLAVVDRRPVSRRPDGTPIEDRAPP
jgi:hypothetical protein